MAANRHSKKARGRQGELRITPKDTNSSSDEDDEFLGNAPRSFQNLGVSEYLELDSRPTFVLDLQALEKKREATINVVPWSLVYCNKALRFFDELRNAVTAETFFPGPPSPVSSTTSQESTSGADLDFKEWATSNCDFNSDRDGYLPRHTFRGMYWTSATLRCRWRVISASQVPNQKRQSHGTPRSNRSTSRSTSTSRSLAMVGIDGENLEESDLSKQLADSESKFKVLTELNPVGMYYLSPEGNILYANDMWYEITGHPRGLEGEMSFMNVISELDHAIIGKEWEILTTQRGKREFELRLRNPWRDDATGKLKQKWILASCDQEFDEEGNLKSIMGCITDISPLKHIEEDAVERANLVEKLALRTQEAAQHEKNFQQMAELAPCGIFIFDIEGTITWANSQWYEMTGHARSSDEHYPMSFLNSIDQQDHEAFHRDWKKLTMAEEVTSELRLKKPWIRQETNGPVRDSRWILFLALPQLDDNGNFTKVFGCTTDISHLKWTESVQMTSRLQAEEAKRQQETFIDMTSHEMRNPLSAIMLCADGIANSLLEVQTQENSAVLSKELIDSNIDAAQTIVLCAQHQKRIIDDVLTLNSTILHVSPVQVEVESTVRRTLKMFEGEMQAHDIKMHFVVEPSFQDAQIKWVFCDPVRLTQVFINLLTNAIKFTRPEEKREIAVTLAASVSTPPKDDSSDIQWFPSKNLKVKNDFTVAPEWGNGELVYLYFRVKDTGRGLSDDEKSRLFHRFSQASPRTHVQYGGSGLGLFISRELTELQGGEIGMTSTAGEGSTFAFYIKARKAKKGSVQSNGSTHNPDSQVQLSEPDSTYNSPSTPPSRPHQRYDNYHILLVEDNLINQKVLSKQLRSAGCTVHVANHGGEALNFLYQTTLWHEYSETPKLELSIILMDLEMPVMDGLAATRAIRDMEREGKLNRHVPIIAVTANTRTEQMNLALEAGMDDIVPKPFHIPDLMVKTDRLISNQSL